MSVRVANDEGIDIVRSTKDALLGRNSDAMSVMVRYTSLPTRHLHFKGPSYAFAHHTYRCIAYFYRMQ